MRAVFRAIKQLAGKNKKPSCTIHKAVADGTSCDSETEIVESEREHFETALNYPTGTSSAELSDEAETATADPMTSVDEPPLEEVDATVRRLKKGRAPDPDGISAESLKFASSQSSPISIPSSCLFGERVMCRLIEKTASLSLCTRKNTPRQTAVAATGR